MQLKRTKIVCTIGPSSWDYETLEKLARAGMNVARLNFSHGSLEEKAEQIKNIRAIARKINKPIAILADLQGPKLRLGTIDGKLEIKKGDLLTLSINPKEDELPMQFDIAPYVQKDHRIFLNDGLVEVKVTQVKGKSVHTIAQNDGWVSSKKGVNIPDSNIGRASFTDKDKEDAEFALKQEVDYIALSFVQTVDDVIIVKDLIKKRHGRTRIISKIEKAEAVNNLEEIIKKSDAVMVARGDLAIETSAAAVPIVQEKIIKLGRRYYKPVIVATQMLESMVENPRPTRAEVSDVANAVLDQVDAVMLSAESANGKYPIEAVKTMKEVIISVEEHPEYHNHINIEWKDIEKEELSSSAIASSAAELALHIGAKMIVVATATGRNARVLSSFRPGVPIFAVTHDILTMNQLCLGWGIKSAIVKPTINADTFWNKIVEEVEESGFVTKGDKIVIITGSKVGVSGATDTIKVATL